MITFDDFWNVFSSSLTEASEEEKEGLKGVITNVWDVAVISMMNHLSQIVLNRELFFTEMKKEAEKELQALQIEEKAE